MEILVEIQDITRFRIADELAAYLGLTAYQYSSGQHSKDGAYHPCGDVPIRTYAFF